MSVITLALGHHAVKIMVFLVCIKAVATHAITTRLLCHGNSAALRECTTV